MSSPSRPEPGPADVPAPDQSGAAAAALLRPLAAEALAVDGTPPFSDQALVDARSGEATVVGDGDAAAILRSASSEAELVVRPALRRQGLGTILLRHVVELTEGPLAVWAHGDHPGAKRLADEFGFTATRRLLQQRAAVSQDHPAPDLPDATAVRPFRPGTDDAAWLDLNARAFAHHPEQGSLTQLDLDARKADDWFDADDFLLVWQGDELVAFCWLKVAGPPPEPGEFYAVGVAPEHQGQHLGGLAVDAGLHRLATRGLSTASLYVEGDNTSALRLYAARGFTDHAVDVQYTLAR
ncbi:mycothiol acetyltransferase [Frondihabitans sucicola]|uniref:Mycothiol acetyltransferase n=1 Tax=Frondihabitans sucicola TaxID=1268041 RepID=A0ABN6XW20_9MICO|nr:mycothiol synthase [Frondihabitans sucicola]BDZ49237.1 mycothiol acetyltransferase [Frondihabitans sucicola]